MHTKCLPRALFFCIFLLHFSLHRGSETCQTMASAFHSFLKERKLPMEAVGAAWWLISRLLRGTSYSLVSFDGR